jgi:NAD(P)-dependent dehydrogenase (short-subunit alcohol dehydrogenase family)
MSSNAPATGRLADKVAIITGAGQNIGRAMAERFAAEGALVAVVDLDADRASRVATGIVDSGRSAIAVAADVTDEAAVSAMVARVLEEWGRVNVLVNNVGATVNSGLLDTTVEQWDRVHSVTLKAPFLCGKHVAKAMIDGGVRGSIVNVGSTSGHRGIRNKIAYAAAKGGVNNLTRAMAMELAPHGIRVNTLTPTQTGSPVGTADEDSSPERAGEARGIPIGRFGRPIDQANVALFLASDEAGFVTGADVVCDGGLLAIFPKST